MAFPIFVVYKHVPGQEQPVGRVVVDMRELNDIVIPDTYPILSQEEILQGIMGCKFITVIDTTSFFY
jgi:hypothetical protein